MRNAAAPPPEKFQICEATQGHSIVMRRETGRASTNTLWVMAEAASVAAVSGAFAERADVTVTDGRIERLPGGSHVEVAAATLVEPASQITSRLRGRRTELEVRVAFGDRSGTKVARGRMVCVVELPRAARCADE